MPSLMTRRTLAAALGTLLAAGTLASLPGAALAGTPGDSRAELYAYAKSGDSETQEQTLDSGVERDWSGGVGPLTSTDGGSSAHSSASQAFDDGYVSGAFRQVTVNGSATASATRGTENATANASASYFVKFELTAPTPYVLYGSTSIDGSGVGLGTYYVFMGPHEFGAGPVSDASRTIGEQGILPAGEYQLEVSVRAEAIVDSGSETGSVTSSFSIRFVVGCQNAYTSGADSKSGTSKADILCGGGGPDTLNGRGGPDILIGSGGGDTLIGGSGKDDLRGGSGGDLLRACDNTVDKLSGGTGTDTGERDQGLDTLSSIEVRRSC